MEIMFETLAIELLAIGLRAALWQLVTWLGGM